MVKDFIFNVKGVEIYRISDFLSTQECDYLARYIEEHNHPSTVSGSGSEINAYSRDRSSNSTSFDAADNVIQHIENKVAAEVGVPLSHSEPLHGIIYREGEQFKDHTDFFGEESFLNHALASGQRTWTVMIYLNEVEAGGHTEFPEIGRSFIPKKGTAVIWKNSDGKGTENHATLHCGMPVVRGKKIIVTKWFREREYQPAEDERLSKQYHAGHHAANPAEQIFIPGKDGSKVPVEYIDGMPHARFITKDNIPALTREGFKKVPIPKSLYHRILAFYYDGLERAKPEFDPNGDDPVNGFISSQQNHYPTEMIWLTEEMKTIIFDGLQDVLTQWSGRKIERTYCYGIRSYKRGAVLKKHTDGFETRIVSAILNIDQKVDEPWALQIDDHQGVEHEVYLEPGEMVLYESAILDHGRVKPLKGDFFTNLFVHYVNLS